MKTTKSKLFAGAGICLLLGVIGAGTFFALQSKAANNTTAKAEPSKKGKGDGKDADKPKAYDFAPADVAKLAQRDLGQVVPVSGSIRPVNFAAVKSRVGAEVARVHVQDGERVTRGQVLVTLDAADWRARFDTQSASVAEARARLTLAQKNQASNKDLLDRKFISQNAYDNTQSNADVAAAALKSAESQLAIVRRQLDETVIRSPIDGVVVKRLVQVGERITEQQTVAQVVDLALMELEALVPLADAPSVRIGSPIGFVVDGFGERQFAGKVERMSPSAETGTRSISVYIRINNADAALKGGMFASGQLELGSRSVSNVLPMAALREEGGSFHVFAISAGKLERRPVEVGTRNLDLGLAEIKSGVTADTVVVAVKMNGLKHGEVATLTSPAAAKPGQPAAAPAAKS
jgi:membrane fusion protein, multidrug efflux system